MAIFKARVQSNYAQIPNATAQDNRLSFEARGVLVMLLSMPDDWEVTKQWLCNQTSAGRDKVQRIINELVQFGYIRKSQQRTTGGKFTSNDMFVFSEPEDVKAVDGLAVDGKTHITKETSLQKKQETNLVQDDDFEKFWGIYDKKKNKDKCIAKWKRLSSEQKEKALKFVRAYVVSTPDKQYRQHPLTWLNNSGWNDEILPPINDDYLNALEDGFSYFWDVWCSTFKNYSNADGALLAKLEWIKIFSAGFWSEETKDDYDIKVNRICSKLKSYHESLPSLLAQNLTPKKYLTSGDWL